MKEAKMVDPLAYLAKLSVPLGVATTLLGGSAWLTTTHNKVETIEKDLTVFTEQWHQQKSKLYDQVNGQDSRLSRIEGKLDMLIETMEHFRRRNASNSNRAAN